MQRLFRPAMHPTIGLPVAGQAFNGQLRRRDRLLVNSAPLPVRIQARQSATE
jgi:hypothetical protein